jgi:general secretion pathway protein J
MNVYIKKLKNKGFTLLEVLIAIAIFSMISLSSFTIFNTVLKSNESSKIHTERVNELQRGFLLIERDLLQIAKRSIRLNGEEPQVDFLYTDNNSFSNSESTLAFVRHGWTNPGLLLPRSTMQSVAYQLNDETFERLHFNFVDAIQGQEPKVRKLITEIEALNFEFYYNKKWQKEIISKSLPQAIAIELLTKDYGLIRREFLVAGDNLANPAAPSGKP